MTGTDSTPSNIYPCIFYDDALAAIEWLCRAFGFEKRLVVPGPNGTIGHSELSLGPGVIMVGSVSAEQGCISARRLPGVHQAICVHIDDPDSHFARAKAAGAVVVREIRDEGYGSRGYMVKDPAGSQRYFGTYLPGAHWREHVEALAVA